MAVDQAQALPAPRLRQLAGPLLIVMILAMMVLPLPPFLLDLLFTFNIALALIVLMVAVYTKKALEFAAFPTVLLLTTLMRLSLNIASTRAVLMQGHTGADAAGKVIEAFGHFVIGERADANPDRAVRQRIGVERGRLERPARRVGDAARHARAPLLTPRQPQQEMQRRAALTFQHANDGALPAAQLGAGGDLGQHGIANPVRGGNALHREDLGETLGPRHAHLVVRGVIHNERPALDALQRQRRARDPVRDRRGC